MKSKQQEPQSQKRSLRKYIIWAVLLVLVVLGIGYFFTRAGHNLASDAASPLESLILDGGATKECTNADPGTGPSNRSPWYEAFYSVPKNEDDTVSLLKSSASKQGFELRHATAQDRGPLKVDDKFIDKWFYDTSQKISPYSELNHGPIVLTATVNADGDATACGSKTLRIDDNHSIIGISLKLPEYK